MIMDLEVEKEVVKNGEQMGWRRTLLSWHKWMSLKSLSNITLSPLVMLSLLAKRGNYRHQFPVLNHQHSMT